ncbi:hypothetical protein P8452_77529 [Trifolium repens]|nr:hypothetical protein P8452_77529 [Trifolium repens]
MVHYNFSVFSVLPIYTKLIKGGLKIWIYSGDADGRVPVIGTRYCVEAFGLPLKSTWRTWYHHNQVGGRRSLLFIHSSLDTISLPHVRDHHAFFIFIFIIVKTLNLYACLFLNK